MSLSYFDHLSNFVISGAAMTAIDKFYYQVNTNKSLYDGFLFGASNVVSQYILDYFIQSNQYNMVAKAVLHYVIYMQLYDMFYVSKYKAESGNKSADQLIQQFIANPLRSLIAGGMVQNLSSAGY